MKSWALKSWVLKRDRRLENEEKNKIQKTRRDLHVPEDSRKGDQSLKKSCLGHDLGKHSRNER